MQLTIDQVRTLVDKFIESSEYGMTEGVSLKVFSPASMVHYTHCKLDPVYDPQTKRFRSIELEANEIKSAEHLLKDWLEQALVQTLVGIGAFQEHRV